jgi:inositol oxygenase
MHNLPQWTVVGDTFPVGCEFSKANVFHEFFNENTDSQNEAYNNKIDIYYEGCGFDNMQFSFGHDEYLYQVCKSNECLIPEEGLYIIKYHSFYPWHTNGGYEYFANKKDCELKDILKAFQKCDLYSKCDEEINLDELLPYYQCLIENISLIA